jgi:hypothetical protein
LQKMGDTFGQQRREGPMARYGRLLAVQSSPSSLAVL